MKQGEMESAPDSGAWRTHVESLENISQESQDLMDEVVSLAVDEGVDLLLEAQKIHATQEAGNKTYGTNVQISDAQAFLSGALNWAKNSGTITGEEYRALSYQIILAAK